MPGVDETLEVLELVGNPGFEGVVVWLLRTVGVIAVMAGLVLWLGLGRALLVLPAALLVLGSGLVVLPELLLELAA